MGGWVDEVQGCSGALRGHWDDPHLPWQSWRMCLKRYFLILKTALNIYI